MKVTYIPQINHNVINYTYLGDRITVAYQGVEEVFDFTGMPDGEADRVKSDVFAFDPVLSAKRINGVLNVELLNFIDSSASEEDRLPKEIEI